MEKKKISKDCEVNLHELIEFIDKLPAILWVGKGGVRENLIEKYGEEVENV